MAKNIKQNESIVIEFEEAAKHNQKVLKEYLNKANALPAIAEKAVNKRCQEQAWKDYIEKLKHLGLEDPGREPTYDELHKQCVI